MVLLEVITKRFSYEGNDKMRMEIYEVFVDKIPKTCGECRMCTDRDHRAYYSDRCILTDLVVNSWERPNSCPLKIK